MFVKICGLTNLQDSLAAAAAGAQAVGFNFVRTSPRFISESAIAPWIGRMPPEIWKVGVFANESSSAVSAVCARLGLDVAQLHGNESPDDVPGGVRVWKAIRITEAFRPAVLDRFQTEAVLLDGPTSGVAFDWSAVPAPGRKLILAGGLDPANVCQAIRIVQPWGVDVCSRIETTPGRKDLALMTRFIEKALSC